MTVSQQGAHVAKKGDSLLCSRRDSIASRLRQVILFFGTGEMHSECWVHFWTPQCKRDMDILETVQ